jgi:hypothetical protein
VIDFFKGTFFKQTLISLLPIHVSWLSLLTSRKEARIQIGSVFLAILISYTDGKQDSLFHS